MPIDWAKYGQKSQDPHQHALDELARMRGLIRDSRQREKAAQLQHRDEAGQFRKHEPVTSHDVLVAHLTGPDHGVALLPEWRGSTRNMQAAHLAMHACGADHDIEDGMSA